MSRLTDSISEVLSSPTDDKIDSLSKEDIKSMVEMLNYTMSNIHAMENKMVAMRDEIKLLKSENFSMAAMKHDFKTVLKRTDAEAETLRATVNRYVKDRKTNYVVFSLNHIRVQMTREQMRQIVTWYEPGKVYFSPDNNGHMNSGGSYYFGEVISYVDHKDESNFVDALVTYEDENVVSIVTIDMLIDQRHITPMHVLKHLVQRKANPPYVVITKEMLGDFLVSINYLGQNEDTAF